MKPLIKEAFKKKRISKFSHVQQSGGWRNVGVVGKCFMSHFLYNLLISFCVSFVFILCTKKINHVVTVLKWNKNYVNIKYIFIIH
jgi:hypothetical protein